MGSVQRGPFAAATLSRAAISRVHTTVTVGYELTSSLGKARIVVYAVPECSGDSERRAHGEEDDGEHAEERHS